MLSKIILLLATLMYMLIGIFITSLLTDEDETPSLLFAILWPGVLIILILVVLVAIPVELAEKIKKR